MALPLPLVSIAHIVAAVFCFITVCLTGYSTRNHPHRQDGCRRHLKHPCLGVQDSPGTL